MTTSSSERNYYGVPIDNELAAIILDLGSIRHDLHLAAELLGRLGRDRDPDDPDAVVYQAMWQAAVIAYRRAFTSGRSLVGRHGSRAKPPQEFLEAVADEPAHQHLLQMANQHVAHRVNEAEQGRLMVLLANPSLGRSIEGVGWLAGRFVGPRPEDAPALAEFVRQLAEVVDNGITSLTDQLIEMAKATDLDALYGRAIPMDGAHPDNPGAGPP